MESAYDVVVVGSGFGGGITACRLAEQGWRVCVLERGRRFGPGDFPDRPQQAPRMFWHARHNPSGFFDLRIMKDVAVMTGAGVGGGSLVYANVQLRAHDDVFFWGQRLPVFENVTGDGRGVGDGGYLFDPDGDVRAFEMYH